MLGALLRIMHAYLAPEDDLQEEAVEQLPTSGAAGQKPPLSAATALAAHLRPDAGGQLEGRFWETRLQTKLAEAQGQVRLLRDDLAASTAKMLEGDTMAEELKEQLAVAAAARDAASAELQAAKEKVQRLTS